MHEVGVAKEILALALAKADARRIKNLAVELGDDGHTTPQSLSDAFALVAKGTLAEGAVLSITRTKELESRLVELEVEQ
ncbi:MAG: hydrogenase/urease maturation nickel metallochaperone HypA [Candidatus Omnitrophica bacterium]|nr:hydrogenase/urease maturation nickel metallochaperone HypA [Candidatus Omnitrophota bacterium]